MSTICNICQKYFSSSQALFYHQNISKKCILSYNSQPICKWCKKGFLTNKDAQKHELSCFDSLFEHLKRTSSSDYTIHHISKNLETLITHNNDGFKQIEDKVLNVNLFKYYINKARDSTKVVEEYFTVLTKSEYYLTFKQLKIVCYNGCICILEKRTEKTLRVSNGDLLSLR